MGLHSDGLRAGNDAIMTEASYKYRASGPLFVFLLSPLRTQQHHRADTMRPLQTEPCSSSQLPSIFRVGGPCGGPRPVLRRGGGTVCITGKYGFIAIRYNLYAVSPWPPAWAYQTHQRSKSSGNSRLQPQSGTCPGGRNVVDENR